MRRAANVLPRRSKLSIDPVSGTQVLLLTATAQMHVVYTWGSKFNNKAFHWPQTLGTRLAKLRNECVQTKTSDDGCVVRLCLGSVNGVKYI